MNAINLISLIMLAVYAILTISCATSWAQEGGDAWGLATAGWACALMLRIVLTMKEASDGSPDHAR